MPPSILILSTAHGMGTGAYVVLENLLRAWRRTDVALHVLTPADSRAAQACRDCGIDWTDWGTHTDALLANGRSLLRHRTLPRPDLVHAWHSRGMEWAWALGRARRCRAAATIHDHPDSPTHGRLRRAIIGWSAAGLDALASVSTAVADAWRARGLTTPMTVVHNGVPDLSAAPRARRPEVVVGFTGMYSPIKGLAAVRSWVEATKDLPVRWKLYGNIAPELAADAQALVAAAGERVSLEGFRKTADIYPEIDILAHPSLAFDSFPTSLLEAMSAGIPVIATDIGGTREIVRDGVTGYLVPPDRVATGADRLRHLLLDANERARLGNAARETYLREFQPARMVEGYAAFWTSIAGQVDLPRTP